MSISNDAILRASECGYRINEDGFLYLKDIKRKFDFDRYGYARFRIRDKRGKVVNIPLHRLLAYQKFGDAIFSDGIQVRHLNGICSDNRWDNIDIGTQSENMKDRSPEERKKTSINTASFRITHGEDKVISIRKDRELGMLCEELMNKYKISSKGTLWFLLNKRHIAGRSSDPSGLISPIENGALPLPATHS
jgi:hypothetical protein